MFDAATISTCFSSLVGFPRKYLNDYAAIDAELLTSESGLMIDQSAHSLLTQENITAIMKDQLNSDVQVYSSGTTYSEDDIIQSSDIIYISLQDANINHTPASSPLWWKATTLISIYLKRIKNGAAINLFNNVFQQKKLYEAAKTLLADTSLYEGIGNIRNLQTNLNRFVGFKFNVLSADTAAIITSIGLQFSEQNPALPLYIYHSSQIEAIDIIPLDYDTTFSFKWKTLAEKLTLAYNSDSIGQGGAWYIGYYQEDIVGSAIWKEQRLSGTTTNCPSCNRINNNLYKQWSKFVRVSAFYVESANLQDDKTIFDPEKIMVVDNQNWGLNFKLQIQCDVSDFICRNRLAFAYAYKTQIVKDILSDMAYSVRNNQLSLKVSQMAMLALNGTKEDYETGVSMQLKNDIKALSFDMSDMNSICLPCNVGGAGIEIASVF